jgi:hypothetical protein
MLMKLVLVRREVYHSSADGNSSLLGCDAMSLAEFRKECLYFQGQEAFQLLHPDVYYCAKCTKQTN